jgi:aspartate/glutamate racemase
MKALGIVGGIGPEPTIEYYHLGEWSVSKPAVCH